jgi:hypothetical protein
MAHNLPEGEVLIISHISPSEWALASLLPLTSNYPTTLLWQSYSGLKKLKPMGVENMAHIFSIVGNK